MLNIIITAMGIGRIILGLAPFVAAAPAAQFVGFPTAHDNPTARLMGRLFGVRDIGLGVLVFYALAHREVAPFIVLFNAATDAGDIVAAGIPIVRRQGIDRAALKSGILAGTAALSWLLVWVFLK